MYLLFESFRNQDSYIWQRMMAVGGKGEWVHCEILFDEKAWRRGSAWLTQGVGFRAFEPIDPKRYEVYQIGSQHWEKAYQYFVENEGKKYDAIGVVGMVYRTALLDNPEHKFCSEVCYEALTQAQFPLPKIDARLISPLQLRRLIRGLGYKPLVYQNS